MGDTIYTRRGLKDGLPWESIGDPCADFSVCMSDAQRFTAHYNCVEVLSQSTGELAYRATRQRPRR